MKYLSSIYLCLLLSFSSQAFESCRIVEGKLVKNSNVIPQFMVGIWAPEDAKFRGQYISDGFAIYLNNNGLGAAIDPYVGARFVATFDLDTNLFSYETINDDGFEPFKVTARYNDDDCTLILKSKNSDIVLLRRFSSLEKNIVEGFKLE